MTDVIPLAEFERKAQREHARVVQTLHDLANKIEALPIAAWGVEELARHLAPSLR